MKELKFIEGELPRGFKQDFEPFLFNESIHRRLQATKDWASFHLLDEGRKSSLASIHFHCQNDFARSPFKAPFGSVEFSMKLPPENLFRFIQQVESSLRAHGARKIRIKNPPGAYRPDVSPLLEVMLQNLGFVAVRAEINTSIAVNEIEFQKKIEKWELRKLRQSKKNKLAFGEIPISSLASVYEFISACRRERKQSLSMTLKELEQVVSVCKKNFFLFGVHQKKELMAASIAIRVQQKILYNFYSGHLRKFDTFSPVVPLIEGMYLFCRKKSIELLDLGTSALDGKPNFGLIEFKQRLGGSFSAKVTFEKDLS